MTNNIDKQRFSAKANLDDNYFILQRKENLYVIFTAEDVHTSITYVYSKFKYKHHRTLLTLNTCIIFIIKRANPYKKFHRGYLVIHKNVLNKGKSWMVTLPNKDVNAMIMTIQLTFYKG